MAVLEFTLVNPKAIMYGFANEQVDAEGRFIPSRFHKVSVSPACWRPGAFGLKADRLVGTTLTVSGFVDDFYGRVWTYICKKPCVKRRAVFVCANLQSAHHVPCRSALSQIGVIRFFGLTSGPGLDRLVRRNGSHFDALPGY